MTTPLRRGDPSSYRPDHPQIAPGKTWRCGRCSKTLGAVLGRWKHRVWGWCCADCKPGAAA